MVVDDCVSLLRVDAKLGITVRAIHQAFGLSKKEVVAEFEKDSLLKYHSMTYLEFLEFMTRIAEIHFEGSEMEGLELFEKVEYLLDEVLPIVDA